MENDVKVPVIILTKNKEGGIELSDYLQSRFPDRNLSIVVCETAEECLENLTVKHYNIVVVDYDRDLYTRAEELIYEAPDKMAVSLVLSSAYDVQFIFRKPSEHKYGEEIDLKPGMPERIVEDHKDHESVAMLISELLEQRTVRRKYFKQMSMVAAALVLFFVIMAVIILV